MPVIIEFSRCIGTYSSAKFEYVIDIPKDLRGLSTEYKLLAIGKGVVNTYQDLDSVPGTITFETTTPSTTYAIIYK